MELKKTSIRILVADHHSLYRQGLITLIESEKDLTVVGTAEDYVHLARELAQAVPDVTITAEDLPGLNGLTGLKTLVHTGTQLLVLSEPANSERMKREDSEEVAALITREEASVLLLPLIRQLKMQSSTLSLQNLSSTIDRLRAASGAAPVVPSRPVLTGRENEILRLLAAGNTVKEAATELDLSVKTVEAHKFNLMRKLRIHSRTELATYARDCGMVSRPAVVNALVQKRPREQAGSATPEFRNLSREPRR